MKKKAPVYISLIIAALLLSGCSSNKAPQNTAAPSSSADLQTEEPVPSDPVTEEIPQNAVIRDYRGAGVENLSPLTIDAGLNGSTNTVAVFGTVYDVRIGTIRLYTEGNFTELSRYDELTNTNIEIINSALTTKEAYTAVGLSFYDEDLNYYSLYFGPEGVLQPGDNETIIYLKSGSPETVEYGYSEEDFLKLAEGSSDAFSAGYVAEDIADRLNDTTQLCYLYLDIESYWLEYDYGERPSLIPLWVSSNMYDVEVVKLSRGEEQGTFVPVDNIKAGSILLCYGIFDSDGKAYEIRFKLKDGTEKAILISYDYSGELTGVSDFRVSIR